MKKFLPKLVLALIFWGIFAYVIFQIPYPDSLTQASIFQILSFFIPLFFALTLTLNLAFNFLPYSLTFSLGIILLLVFKALSSLGVNSAVLTIISTFLLLSYFKQFKKKGSSYKSKPSGLVNLDRKK